MMHKAWRGIEKMPYFFSRSSIQFQGHMGKKVANLVSILAFKFTRPFTSIKCLGFALLILNSDIHLSFSPCDGKHHYFLHAHAMSGTVVTEHTLKVCSKIQCMSYVVFWLPNSLSVCSILLWPIIYLFIVYNSSLTLVSSLSVNSSLSWCFLFCIPDCK